MPYTTAAFAIDPATDVVTVTRGSEGNASVVIGTTARRVQIICASMADLVQIGMAITDQAARLALQPPQIATVTDDLPRCAACAELGHDEANHHGEAGNLRHTIAAWHADAIGSGDEAGTQAFESLLDLIDQIEATA